MDAPLLSNRPKKKRRTKRSHVIQEDDIEIADGISPAPYPIMGIEEDAIDTEALQAQIDLSMSFAQNLVSSWIQPHKIPRNSHKKDLEKELSEYMHRPARLGVGASIPEGHASTTREAARLKGQLAGTKHSRQDEDVIAPQQPSDGEGESRASAIKKRPKYDPFNVVHGKKKKKEKDIDDEDVNPQPASPNVTQFQARISPKEIPNIDGPEPGSPTPSPLKKQKKLKKLKVENAAYDVQARCEAGASSTLLCNGSSNVLSPPSTPSHSADLNLDAAIPKSQQIVDVSLTSTSASIKQTQYKFIPLDLLKRPLLNLNGLHSNRDSDHGWISSSSPRKKRKRRRKKKNASILSAKIVVEP